jgi:aryl carrier-like protein
MEFFQKGYISPVRPVKIFPAASTEDAFRYMQKGQHIGRIGVSIRESPADTKLGGVEITKRIQTMKLDNSASYLLIGGLGGLGRAISAWMVEHNARQLVYLSRSAGTGSGDESFINELNSMGCDVKLVRGDVTNPEDVTRAVAAATGPLKGIIQMSMVLRDGNLENMTLDEWNAVTRPKVQGTWNLHNATVSTGVDLDFFILFGSLSGVFGQVGQSNYASANTFLDAFAQYRTGLGLAASVIDIGAVEDVGFISQTHGLINRLETVGFKGIGEQVLLDAMAVAIMTPRSGKSKARSGSSDTRSPFADSNSLVLGLGLTGIPLTSPNNRAIWRRDRRMAAYHDASSGSSTEATASSNEALKTYLTAAKADPSILKTAEASNLFAIEIGKKLFDLLLRPQEDLNTSSPLVDLGLDSLVALELRAWWKQVFFFDISVLEMLGMGSLDALGQHAAENLLRIATEESEKNGSG